MLQKFKRQFVDSPEKLAVRDPEFRANPVFPRETIAFRIDPTRDGSARIRFSVSPVVEARLSQLLESDEGRLSNRSLFQGLVDIATVSIRNGEGDRAKTIQSWRKAFSELLHRESGLEGVPYRRVTQQLQRLFNGVRDTREHTWSSSNVVVEVLSLDGDPVIQAGREVHPVLCDLDQQVEDQIKEYELRAIFRPSGGHNPQARISQARQDAFRFRKLHNMVADGFLVRESSEEIGVNHSLGERWARGELPSSIRFLKQYTENPTAPEKAPVSPLDAPIEWARLLGAYCATSRGGVGPYLEFSKQDAAPVDAVTKAFESVLPDGGWVRTEKAQSGGVRVPTVRLFDGNVRELLLKLTRAGQRIPLDALGSMEERREFLKAFCSFSGSCSDARFQIKSAKNEVFVTQLAVLFQTFGVTPRVTVGTENRLLFDDATDLEKLMEEGIIESASQQQAIRSIIEKKRTSGRSHHSAERYQAAMRMHEEDPDRSVNSIARELGASQPTVTKWVRGESLPHSLQRIVRLEELRFQHNVPTAKEVCSSGFLDSGRKQAALSKLTERTERLGRKLQADRGTLLTVDNRRTSEFMDLLKGNTRVASPATFFTTRRMEALFELARSLNEDPKSLEECRWAIVTSHMDSLLKIARRVYYRHGVLRAVFQPTDVNSIAIEAAFDATERFDPTRGVKFTTFVEQRIRGAMLGEARKLLPETPEVAKAARQLDIVNGPLLAENVAGQLGVTKELAQRAIDLSSMKYMSMNSDESTLEVMAAQNVPERAAQYREIPERLLQGLNPVERYAIIAYYVEGRVLNEIGDAVDLSESRVSMIVKKAKERLEEWRTAG